MFRSSPDDAPPPREPRRRLLDNPRVLTVVAVLLLAVLAGLFWLSDRTADIAPQVLTDVLLYALLAVDVALLLALGFVLARNLLKLWVEQRQAAPFARFRAKLVAALLAMSIIPAVLVLFSGSEITPEQRRPVVQRTGGRDSQRQPVGREPVLPGAEGGDDAARAAVGAHASARRGRDRRRGCGDRHHQGGVVDPARRHDRAVPRARTARPETPRCCS